MFLLIVLDVVSRVICSFATTVGILSLVRKKEASWADFGTILESRVYGNDGWRSEQLKSKDD